MSINPQTYIELDERLIGNFNAENLQNRTDQLGFFKRSESVYVISTRTIAENPNFNSKISDLSGILSQSIFQPEAFSKLNAENSFMVNRYLNCVFKVIDKHNTKVNCARSGFILSILLWLPLINRIVNVFYYTIQQPRAFWDRFKEQQKQKIDGLMEGASTLKGLSENKSRLDRANGLVSSETVSLNGNGFTEDDCSFVRQSIRKAFENSLEKKSSGLANARKVIAAPLNEIFPEKTNITFEDVENTAKALLAGLELTPEVSAIVTEGQQALREEALERVKQAQGDWILRHVSAKNLKAMDIGERATIQHSLGVNRPLEMAQRLEKFHHSLLLMHELGKDMLDRLETSFHKYIEPLWNDLVKDAKEMEKQHSLKEIKETYNDLSLRHQAYRLFRAFYLPSREKEAEIRDKEINIANIRDKRLCQLIPLYAISRTVLNLGSYQSDVPLIGQSNAANYSETWYKDKLNFFAYEMPNLDRNEITNDTYEIITKAHLYLQNQYARCKQERMEAIMRDQSKTKGLWGHFNNWIFGKDNGQEQPEKMYKNSLKKLLEMKDSDNLADAYAKKLLELQELPDHAKLKEIIQTALQGYNRAMEIQPFVRKVAAGLFGGKLTYEDLNPKNHDLEKLREEILRLTRLLEQEIEVQKHNNNGGLATNMEKTRIQMLQILNQQIAKQYPYYNKLQDISEDIRCKRIFSPKMGATSAHAEYLRHIKQIEEGIKEGTPEFVKSLAVETKLVLTYAYKEWEADRILKVANKESEYQVYGIPHYSVDEELRARKKVLFLLLHEDRNKDVPEPLRSKIFEAGKIVGAVQQK